MTNKPIRKRATKPKKVCCSGPHCMNYLPLFPYESKDRSFVGTFCSEACYLESKDTYEVKPQ
jgi:hypothetical protein